MSILIAIISLLPLISYMCALAHWDRQDKKNQVGYYHPLWKGNKYGIN